MDESYIKEKGLGDFFLVLIEMICVVLNRKYVGGIYLNHTNQLLLSSHVTSLISLVSQRASVKTIVISEQSKKSMNACYIGYLGRYLWKFLWIEIRSSVPVFTMKTKNVLRYKKKGGAVVDKAEYI